MVRIKVCGIRTLEEGLWAVEAGADALGFVFHPESRRYIEPRQAQAITAKLPPFVARVGVFVDKPRDAVETLVDNCGLTIVQLHGLEEPKDWSGSRFPIIKALKVPQGDGAWERGSQTGQGFLTDQGLRPENDLRSSYLEELYAWRGIAQAILIDSTVAGRFGGTGTTLPWVDESLQRWIFSIKAAGFPLILAGGLTAQNVQEGMRLTEPYALDISSGVERNGQKDPVLLQEFFHQALTPA